METSPNCNSILQTIKCQNTDFEEYIKYYNQQLLANIEILYNEITESKKKILDTIKQIDEKNIQIKDKDKQIEILTSEKNKTKEIIIQLQEKLKLLKGPVIKKESDLVFDKNTEGYIKPPKKRQGIDTESKCRKCGCYLSDNDMDICRMCRWGKYSNTCRRCNKRCNEAHLFCYSCSQKKGICLICSKNDDNIICSECSQTVLKMFKTSNTKNLYILH